MDDDSSVAKPLSAAEEFDGQIQLSLNGKGGRRAAGRGSQGVVDGPAGWLEDDADVDASV